MMDKSPADQTDLEWNEALYGAFSDGYREGRRDGLDEGGIEAVRRAADLAMGLVSEQAEDEGLWFVAEAIPETYLQHELRRLHAAVEAIETAMFGPIPAPPKPIGLVYADELLAMQQGYRTHIEIFNGKRSSPTVPVYAGLGLPHEAPETDQQKET